MTSTAPTLMYQLRSPTTPNSTKLDLIRSAFASPSTSFSTTTTTTTTTLQSSQVRDWILDLFLRSRTIKSDTDVQSVLLESGWWQVLDLALTSSSGVGSTPSLQSFVAFVTKYTSLPSSDADAELVNQVLKVAVRLLGPGMRKTTVDAGLESLTGLWSATNVVVERGGEDVETWEELVELWLKAFRSVVSAGKGGKKIPQQTLANLPSILPLLSNSTVSSTLQTSILQTIQITVFSLDNLRRGIARESYHAGGGSGDSAESAVSELFNALKSFVSTEETAAHVYTALPSLFQIYNASLSLHSLVLFPLPSKSSFPTPAAFRSASELHALQKRRALSGGWIAGVLTLVEWSDASKPSRVDRTKSLSEVLEVIDKEDLYRIEETDGWNGVLKSVVDGAVGQLEKSQPGEEREALMALLDVTTRLAYTIVDPSLDTILSVLASSPPSNSTSTSAFLSTLLVHFTRSQLVPSLLSRLSSVLSSPTATLNNSLTSHSFSTSLQEAIAGLVGVAPLTTWQTLVSALPLPSSSSSSINTTAEDPVEDDSPKKKRRKVASSASDDAASSLAARIRVLTLFVGGIPKFSAVEAVVSEARDEWMQEAIKEVVKGRGGKAVGREVLELRYAVVERLRGEGLSEDSWGLKGKVVDGLKELVSGEEADLVVVAARTLLQSINSATSEDRAHAIIAAILERIKPTTTVWSGHFRESSVDEVPVALWELVSRRWMATFEAFASSDQLAQLANVVASASALSTAAASLSFEAVTARLLRRADFFELERLQGCVHAALLKEASISQLESPTDVLASTTASKVPKPLRSLPLAAFNSAVSTFDRVTRLVSMEYLNKPTRVALLHRALSLDVWASAGKVEMSEEELSEVQRTLRKFSSLAIADGVTIEKASELLALLSRGTAISSPATTVTLDLYTHFVKSTINAYKSDQNSAPLLAFFEAIEKPFSDLAKRYKGSIAPFTCEELAVVTLFDTLGNSGDFSKLSKDTQEAVRRAVKAASKPLGKILASTSAALEADPQSVFSLAQVVSACHSIWQLSEIVGTADESAYATYSTFAENVLTRLTTVVASAVDASSQPGCHDTVVAVLRLLAFRLSSIRAQSNPLKISTQPFVTFVACHLAFRQALGTSATLEELLKRGSTVATLREYEAALLLVASTIGDIVASGSEAAVLESCFPVALILLRDGPEGSSRLASTCLSEILRHLSLFLVEKQSGDAQSSSSTLLALVRFIEGVCGDRPMLLSRQNVSSVLAIACRVLQPSVTASHGEVETTSASTASHLFLGIVSSVDMLIRHRKDHVTHLFPHLVACIAALLSVLRRMGYGTTGSLTNEMGGATVALGRRAEREARSTFPAWAWNGGARAIGRPEARAVGRLLGSLTTKTVTLKRKRDAADKEKESDTANASLSAPLSKHAPFIILPYVRACVDPISPIPSALRSEMQGGWFEVMEVLGKWEREALIKGFLGDEEEAERGVLRSMWKTWEKERYRG